MTDNAELQRLIRLSRLGRQIAARLPGDRYFEQAFQMHGRELPAPRFARTPTPSKAVLRSELEAAMANYRGQVTLCPPAAPPEPDRTNELSFVDDDELDEDPVPGRRPSRRAPAEGER
jgi:hypothetical protein